MADEVELPLIDKQELEIHKLYRERIVQEDGLINHRMMWMVLSQAFILALWGVLLRELFNDHKILKYGALGLLDVMGLLFATGSYFSIRAAQREIGELRDRYLEFYPLDPNTLSAKRITRKSTGPTFCLV